MSLPLKAGTDQEHPESWCAQCWRVSFSLAAAIKNRAFAAEKYVAELEDDTKRLKKWIAEDEPGAFQAVDDAERRARDTRDEYSIKTKKKWSAFDTAREAGLVCQYGRSFTLYSQHIHSKNGALIASELELDREVVLESVIFIVLEASERIASAPQAGTSQTNMGEIARLWDAGITLIKMANDESAATRDDRSE
jgi:hypothetical protein